MNRVDASPATALTAPQRRAATESLLAAAALFVVAVLVHNGDHLRRGTDTLDLDVFWIGTAGIFVEVAVVVLVCQRHRWAPLAAAVAGATLTLGYVVVHFLPDRSWLSDSFVSADDVSALSWFAASFEVLAATVLAIVGLVALRARGGLASAAQPIPAESTLGAGLAHPLALTFAVGQAAILLISFVQIA